MTEPAEPPRPHLRPVPPDNDQPTEPHDLDAERAILGACLLDPRTIADTSRHIAGDEFYTPFHADVWHALLACQSRGEPLEPAFISRELTARGRTHNRAQILALLDATPTASNATHYAQIVADLAQARRLRNLGIRLVQAAGTTDPTRVRDALTQAHEWITHAVEDQPYTETADPRLVPGGQFLLADTDTIDAIWGNGDDVFWMRGESLIIAGPSGVGKTTTGQQVTLARIGARPPEFLGQPLQPAGRCLYLAMDRPMQAKRSLRRMVDDTQADLLDERLIVWKGPPPEQVVANPRALLELALRAGLHAGDFVVVDSVKDVAIGIAQDDVGAAVNIALQELLAAGVDVLALHHTRKANTSGGPAKEPESLDEIYGSSHIVNGSGSVLSLWGKAGDPIVALRHLKQPAGEVGPYKLKHDHVNGVTDIWHGIDILDAVLGTGTHGMSAKALATLLFPKMDDVVNTDSEVEKSRRRLDKLVADGLLVRRDPDVPDGAKRPGRGQVTLYFARFSRSGEMIA